MASDEVPLEIVRVPKPLPPEPLLITAPVSGRSIFGVGVGVSVADGVTCNFVPSPMFLAVLVFDAMLGLTALVFLEVPVLLETNDEETHNPSAPKTAKKPKKCLGLSVSHPPNREKAPVLLDSGAVKIGVSLDEAEG